MAMIAMLSGKAAPGVTTSVALLAANWPGPVVVADVDPTGGDLTTGWLGGPAANSSLLPDRSIVSFAIEAQDRAEWTPEMLEVHLQPVASAPHCLLLAGLTDPSRVRFVQTAGWHRLAHALANVSRPGPHGVDVLVDCGRFSPDTPLPLLSAADLVLITVRPQHRHTSAAQYLASRLRQVVGPDHLGLAVCATSTFTTIEVEQQVGLHVVVELPDDRRGAKVFSDGARQPIGFRRSRLVRAATRTAARLHDVLNDTQQPEVAASPPLSGSHTLNGEVFR